MEIDDPDIGPTFKLTYEVQCGGEVVVAEGIRKAKQDAKKAAAAELCANGLFLTELATLLPATRHQNHGTWIARSPVGLCGGPPGLPQVCPVCSPLSAVWSDSGFPWRRPPGWHLRPAFLLVIFIHADEVSDTLPRLICIFALLRRLPLIPSW